MKGKYERKAYLDPKEQLMISLKVNRLCQTDSKTFQPTTQVPDAQEIVKALDSRIKPSGRIGLDLLFTFTGFSEELVGATNAGDVKGRFEKEETEEIKLGVEEYRIGNYVANKTRDRKNSIMTFQHFWDWGAGNEDFEKGSKHTLIKYENKDLDVIEISMGMPVILKFGPFLFANYKYQPLWEKGGKK